MSSNRICPTAINHIGGRSLRAHSRRLEQGLAKTADHLSRIIAIKEECSDAVLSHRTDAMAEDQPSGIGFYRSPAVPDLDQFPRKSRCQEHLPLIPEVDIIG